MDRSQPLVTFGRERSDVSTFNSPVMLRDQRNLLNKWQDGEKVKAPKPIFDNFRCSYIKFHFFALFLRVKHFVLVFITFSR